MNLLCLYKMKYKLYFLFSVLFVCFTFKDKIINVFSRSLVNWKRKKSSQIGIPIHLYVFVAYLNVSMIIILRRPFLYTDAIVIIIQLYRIVLKQDVFWRKKKKVWALTYFTPIILYSLIDFSFQLLLHKRCAIIIFHTINVHCKLGVHCDV